MALGVWYGAIPGTGLEWLRPDEFKHRQCRRLPLAGYIPMQGPRITGRDKGTG